jgi:hypothetical protein
VIDAGGGTSCIVRYILTGLGPPQFKQEFAAESEFLFISTGFLLLNSLVIRYDLGS